MDTHFEVVTDPALVRTAMCHESVYPHVSDDGCPASECFEPAPGFVYVGAWLDGVFGGVFVIHQHNVATIEVHTCLLPVAWGKAVDIGRALIAWIFGNTDYRRMVTSVPEYNRLALRLALGSGMTEYGRNPASFLKNGKLHAQILLGVSKEQ